MGDEEDDYMSDNFLAMTQNVKPGIGINVAHKRILKIEAERVRHRQSDESKPKKRELEKILREEALSKPVPETSKGFALMAKMGFKPGMSLGKKRDESDSGSGIKEPIAIEVKTRRTGLGHDSILEEQAKQRLRREMERMKRRAEQTEELVDDYRKRKRDMSNTKDLICDILASRKICVELDLRINVELPEQSWFWKSYKQPDNKGDDTEEYQNPDAEESSRYLYVNGKDAPQEERFDELTDEELREKLTQITCYLRATHRYCIWCGCQFEQEEELENYCPGPDRNAHDSMDE